MKRSVAMIFVMVIVSFFGKRGNSCGNGKNGNGKNGDGNRQGDFH